MSDSSRLRRLPLRDLLNHVEHKCRELAEHLQMDLTPTAAEFHKLTRPVRKKSAYPSLRSVCNVHERMRRSQEHAMEVTEQIEDCIKAIEERVQVSRKE